MKFDQAPRRSEAQSKSVPGGRVEGAKVLRLVSGLTQRLVRLGDEKEKECGQRWGETMEVWLLGSHWWVFEEKSDGV